MAGGHGDGCGGARLGNLQRAVGEYSESVSQSGHGCAGGEPRDTAEQDRTYRVAELCSGHKRATLLQHQLASKELECERQRQRQESRSLMQGTEKRAQWGTHEQAARARRDTNNSQDTTKGRRQSHGRETTESGRAGSRSRGRGEEEKVAAREDGVLSIHV